MYCDVHDEESSERQLSVILHYCDHSCMLVSEDYMTRENIDDTSIDGYLIIS